MKKLLFVFLMVSICGTANAGTLTLTSYLSGGDVTIASLESDNNAVETWANGNVESINIKDKTITTADLADSVSPVVRWGEGFSDFTYTGMLPVTSATLISDISAGTSYIDGFRVVQSSVSHTYTASRDTYVYIHRDGYYLYQEVANGAAAPATPANSLLLAKVVTDGTSITSVTDSRTTSIQITATTSNFPSHFRDGALMSWDTTTAIHAIPGSLAIGTTIYSRTTNTSAKTITTASNWIENQVPYENDTIFVYAYNDSGSSWDIKFSSADPVYADVSENTSGTLRYYSPGTTDYRAIGWWYKSADQVQVYAFGNVKESATHNAVQRVAATETLTASTNYIGLSDMKANFYSTGRPIMATFSAPFDDTSGDPSVAIYLNNSLVIDKDGVGDTGGNGLPQCNLQWLATPAQGPQTIEVYWKVGSGTGTQDAANDGYRTLVVQEL